MPHEEIQTKIPCPECKSALTELNYSYSSGIIIDRCSKKHGIWLDGGELEKLQAHHEHWEREVKNGKQEWMKIVKRIGEEKNANSPVITNQEFSPVFRFFMGQLATKISKRVNEKSPSKC